MCMLFAASAAREIELQNELTGFYKNSDKHPHGWGIAYKRGGRLAVKKDCVRASDSETLRRILRKPLKSSLVLAHIRYATIGNVEAANCHPFTGTFSGRQLTLVHNGTVFDYPPLSRFIKRQKGETDSERIFLCLAEEYVKERDNDRRFERLSALITDMSRGNKLNLIFTDGETLCIHTNCRDTLFFCKRDGAILFATTPLTDEKWEAVPFCRLLAYRNGELLRKGEPHENEYIENSENLKLLYRIFSGL